MHEMLTILTNARGVCLSVSLSVTLLKSAAAHTQYMPCAWGHLVQPLLNQFDHLFILVFTDVSLIIVYQHN